MKAATQVRFVLPLALFLFAVLLYTNTLGHDFVFDDVTLILQNPQVTELQWKGVLSFSTYRPVRTLTYLINFWLGGRSPFGYHLFNVLLHALNTLLVFWLFYRLRSSQVWAAIGALVFAAHPVQTAAVAYISGRKDMLAAAFMLSGLLAYLQYRKSRRRGHLLLVVLCFGLGVLSKELALVFPALLLLAEACHPLSLTAGQAWSGLLQSLRRYWWLFLGTAAMAAVGLYYSVEVLQASRMEGVWGGSWAANWGTSFKLFVHYLRLALVPYPLLADYQGQVLAFSPGLSDPATLASVAALLGFVGMALWSYAREPGVSFGMLWFLISLLPVLQLIPFHEPAADHFLYVPFIGLAYLAGMLGDRLLRRIRNKVWVWGGLAALIVLYSGLTIDRNRDWKDNLALWSATYKQAPGSYRANCNLGGLAQQQGDLDKAVRLTQRCVELDPGKALPYANLGGIYRDLGSRAREAGRLAEARDLLQRAIEYSQKAIEIDPSNPWSRSNLADAYKDLALIAQAQGEGRRRVAELRLRAAREFKRAIARSAGQDTQAVIVFKLAAVYLDAKNYEEALRYLLQCADQLKHWAQPQAATGYAYLQLGRPQESIEYFKRALALEANLDAVLGLARALEASGDSQQAAALLQKALGSFPNNADVLFQLGRLQADTGDQIRAREYLLRALQFSERRSLSQAIERLLNQISEDPEAPS